MRFGISATSWILPKNLRTRLRPVNVSAIVASRFVRRIIAAARLPTGRNRPGPEACYASELSRLRLYGAIRGNSRTTETLGLSPPLNGDSDDSGEARNRPYSTC